MDDELIKGMVGDIASSSGLVVTTPKAVRPAKFVDESTKVILDILDNCKTEDPKQ